MNFYTVRDLRTTPKSIWENLVADGEVVITNNGKPTAIMLDISGGNFEEMLKAICVVSANDCVVAMSEFLAGSEEVFVQQMNDKAKELGMTKK